MVAFPDRSLPVFNGKHSSPLVFLIQSRNAAKRVNAFRADVGIGSDLLLGELLSLRNTLNRLLFDSKAAHCSPVYDRL